MGRGTQCVLTAAAALTALFAAPLGSFDFDPAAAPTHYDRGLAAYQDGRLESARDSFIEALRIDDSDAYAQRALLRVEEELRLKARGS